MDEVKHKCPNCGPDGIAHVETGIRRGLVPSEKYAKLEKECTAWKAHAMAWQNWENTTITAQALRDLGVME